MMHDQLADYFDFLGLKGYKRLHEYQHLAESIERRKICKYRIERHGKLIKNAFSGEVKMIPDSWYSAKSISVGKGTKQKAVEDGFSAYREWEEETKEVYQIYAAALPSVMMDASETLIKKYSNGKYDKNIDPLYDEYIAAKMAYQEHGDAAHKDKLMDSVGRLMVEVFDMLQAMILDADFRDERQAIMQQIRKLADS